MARDCAAELLHYNIAFVSLWPGPVKTEFIQAELDKLKKSGKLTGKEKSVRRLISDLFLTAVCQCGQDKMKKTGCRPHFVGNNLHFVGNKTCCESSNSSFSAVYSSLTLDATTF